MEEELRLLTRDGMHVSGSFLRDLCKQLDVWQGSAVNIAAN